MLILTPQLRANYTIYSIRTIAGSYPRMDPCVCSWQTCKGDIFDPKIVATAGRALGDKNSELKSDIARLKFSLLSYLKVRLVVLPGHL